MPNDSDSIGQQGRDRPDASQGRREREAKALRDNLARRKAQQRQRREAADAAGKPDAPHTKAPARTD